MGKIIKMATVWEAQLNIIEHIAPTGKLFIEFQGTMETSCECLEIH